MTNAVRSADTEEARAAHLRIQEARGLIEQERDAGLTTFFDALYAPGRPLDTTKYFLVFVDALLPYPGASSLESAPALEIDQLTALATDGLLAPWNTWFPEDPLRRLLPDAELREAFVLDLPRTPFAFLEAKSPNRSEWEQLPAAYIQLSRNYEDQAARAEARGWTVRRARLNHLAIASHPAEVAALLSDLLMAYPTL